MLDTAQALRRLEEAGWTIRPLREPDQLPGKLLERYPWMPQDLQSFLSQYETICRQDEKVWLLLVRDFKGESESAYAWNEWELQSLNAAKDDEAWQHEIRQFWDAHIPIALTLDDGYGYYALRPDNTVVRGREPEYEQTQKFADSFSDFLESLATSNKAV